MQLGGLTGRAAGPYSQDPLTNNCDRAVHRDTNAALEVSVASKPWINSANGHNALSTDYAASTRHFGFTNNPT